MTEPKDFSDLFDQDGEVKETEQPQHEAPPAIATHIIHNTNQLAGVELNLFFKTPEGFTAHMKIHGTDGSNLLDQGEDVLTWLEEQGWTPEFAPATATPTEPTREDLPQDGTASTTFCTIHQVTMERREKDGDAWYSHQTDDPAYKRKDGKPGYCRGPK